MKSKNLFSYILVSLILQACNTNKKVEVVNIKPNIILIVADDLGYGDLGVYGQEKIETPNIDALAKEGMLFKNFYTAAPVCAPARAMLLSGQHSGHCYIRGNDEWAERGPVWDYKAAVKDANLEGQRPLPDSMNLLPSLLKANGYVTGMIGKWGLGAPLSNSIPTKKGFDYFFGYNCQRQAHTFYPVHLYENEKRYYLKNDTLPLSIGLVRGVDTLDENTYNHYNQNKYSETVSFDKLIGFVEKNKSNPFFLYWASAIPHVPLQAPKNWVDYYHKKFGDEKPYVYYDKKGSYYPCRYPRATYAAMISYLDENVGKLIAQLKKEGLYENTLILFTSDNGPTYTGGADSPWFDSARPFNSEFGKGKGFLHEGGIRVPLIAAWPNKIKANTQTNHSAVFYDIVSTICDVVNTKNSLSQDGLSFLPSLLSKNQPKHDYLYWEFPETGGQAAIRKGDMKVLWKNILKGNKEIEVYNLKTDPKETKNIASTNQALVDEFKSIIRKEHRTPELKRFRLEGLEEVCAQH
jgi:arylsulfatase A-like enzyme